MPFNTISSRQQQLTRLINTDANIQFVLLAIAVEENCSKTYSKNLNNGAVYNLFSNIINNNRTINYDRIENIIQYDSNPFERKITISSIVGKNGSGKSALVELIYLALFYLSFQNKWLQEQFKAPFKYNKSKENLDVTLYYRAGIEIYALNVKNEASELQFYFGEKWESTDLLTNKNFSDKLFYLIGLNYSHHSLNSLNPGARWIDHIFQKNDGYRVPIVINPYREEGNININNETYLSKQRILSAAVHLIKANSIVLDKAYKNNSILGRMPYKVKLRINQAKLKEVDKFLHEDKTIDNLTLFNSINTIFGNTKIYSEENKRPEWRYISRKIHTIISKYNKFLDFRELLSRDKPKDQENIAYNEDVYDLVEALIGENSHITFKLNQAINSIWSPVEGRYHHNEEYTLRDLEKIIPDNITTSEIINFLPPAIFDIELFFSKDETIDSLSSGERQKLFSLSTIIYHLLNLASVSNGEHTIKYKRALIVLDELEMYFHPEFQRTLLHDLIEVINVIPLLSLNSIHILLVTHSPFILSDIHSSSILGLKEGNPEKLGVKTFGSNIYDILKNAMFLENGPLGELFNQHFNKLAQRIEQDDSDLDSIKRDIDLIEDKLLKQLLNSRLNQIHNDRAH